MDKVLEHLGDMKLELGPVSPGRGNWQYATDTNGILWLVLDRDGTGTNTISQDVIRELSDLIAQAEANPPKALVIRSAKPGGFAAGADIGSFDAMTDNGAADLLKQGHAVMDRIAALPFPTICVVHGAALGAGFELALACDIRIAVEGASFGFPEVKLGLHPGLGGTFRLPALIDATEALTLMLTGKTAHTAKAKSLGIADVVVQERHVAAAVLAAATGKIKEREGGGVQAGVLLLKPARSLAAGQMRREAAKHALKEHYPAPYALIDMWETHGDDPAAMQKAEIASFAALLKTETSKNLRRAFFLRQSLKDTAKGDDEISHVHVVGAGAMGGSIAAWAALKGKTVTLGDIAADALGKAVAQAESICKQAHLSAIQTRDTLDRMMPDPRGYGIARADLVIEAAPENAELKEQIYTDLGKRIKSGAILATNTSSLQLKQLVGSVKHPGKFAGLHFFNPVEKMELVEVVAHEATDAKVIRRLASFCGAIGKLPVQVTDYPGFLVNRALTPYLMEAMVLMDEGIDKEVIDSAAIRFGMPMGPVALADQIGLDIALYTAESLKGTLDKPMAKISEALRKKVEKGETGKKAGQGFYDWWEGKPRLDTDEPGPDDMTDRLILPILDACVVCLREGVARNADDVDAAMIFATGFAPFRGGPMHYARTRGAKDICARLDAFAKTYGPRFEPDEGWSTFE